MDPCLRGEEPSLFQLSRHHRAFPAEPHSWGPTLRFPLAQSPPINQQRFPSQYSHAGQLSRRGKAHRWISRQALIPRMILFFHGRNKKDLAFKRGRYFAPASSKLLHCTERGPQDIRRLSLTFRSFWRMARNSDGFVLASRQRELRGRRKFS